MSIPWRFLKNWTSGSAPLVAGDMFTYHAATQAGPVNAGFTYNAAMVKDNMGSCCESIPYVEIPAMALDDYSRQILSPLSQRFVVTLSNTKNIPEILAINSISFTNLQLNGSLPFSMSDFSVSVNGTPFVLDPIFEIFNGNGTAGIVVSPGNTATFTIDVSYPSNGVVLGARTTILPALPIFNGLPISCRPVELGGGPGSPPIIYDNTTESRFPATLAKEDQVMALKVFPNPGNEIVTVIVPAGARGSVLRVDDMAGKTVEEIRNLSSSVIQLKSLRSGAYIVRLILPNGKTLSSKLIIQ
jgi:hypothetical protein